MAGVLTILAAWFAVSVLTAAFISAVAHALQDERRSATERTRRRRRATWSQAVLFGAAVGVAVAHSRPEDWQPVALVCMLTALAVASDAVPLALGGYRFTGGFVAIVLAMALLGAAPAVATAIVCVAIDAVRTRPSFPYLLNNLAAYATFPLAGGLVLEQVHGAVPLAVACFVVAVAVNLLNFVIIAGHTTLRDGDPLLRAVRQTWLPVLRWEVAVALMAALTVYGYGVIGPVVVAGFAVSLAVLQLLAARIVAAASRAPHILKTP